MVDWTNRRWGGGWKGTDTWYLNACTLFWLSRAGGGPAAQARGGGRGGEAPAGGGGGGAARGRGECFLHTCVCVRASGHFESCGSTPPLVGCPISYRPSPLPSPPTPLHDGDRRQPACSSWRRSVRRRRRLCAWRPRPSGRRRTRQRSPLWYVVRARRTTETQKKDKQTPIVVPFSQIRTRVQTQTYIYTHTHTHTHARS
jgi:hypothetical protein